jgi:uncharacterized Ntn-hydrolase superfamily protein
MKKIVLIMMMMAIGWTKQVCAQDTFSIVAIDSVTGEVGSAGASCVDLILFFPNYAVDFLGDLIPGQGAINTQASYDATNQTNARTRLLAGDTPQQIISWLIANDVSGSPVSRQYGIASFVNGSPQTAGYTGSGTLNYKNHIAGVNYCIQGNILSGQFILDSIEARFLNAQGDLACKLMAALQGAKVVGADTRCTNNNSSSLFAFLKVAQPSDTYGNPSLLVKVKTPGGARIEPIDSLQTLFDVQHSCLNAYIPEKEDRQWKIYPNPANDRITFESLVPLQRSTEARYEISDALGRTVRSGVILGMVCTVDIEDLAPGSYLIEIKIADQRVQRKLIKR